MLIEKNKILFASIIFFITFFTYSGYYAGLGIILELFGNSASRFYSIPLRLIYCFLCFCFIVYSVICYLNNNKKINSNIIFLFFSISIFIFYLSVHYLLNINENISTNQSYEYFFYLIAYALFPFLFYSLMNYRKYERLLIFTNIISGLILGLVSILLYRSILGDSFSRISTLKYEGVSDFLSPLALSYSASLAITLSIFYWLNSNPNKYLKILLLFSIGVSLFVFLLGASRGSILTIFSCFLIYFVTLNVKKIFISIASFFALIVIMYYAAIYSGSSIFDRFLNIGSAYSNNDSSVTGRLDIWKEAIFLIKQSPILGGNFEANNVYPHNIFLEALMSTGVLGFLIFIFITIYGLYLSSKAYLCEKKYLPFIILVHGIVMGLFSGSLYTSILFFVGLGLTISYHSEMNKNEI